MGGLRPKQLARIGMFYIEEAILDLLLKAEMNTGEGLDTKEIGRKLGAYMPEFTHPDEIINGTIVFAFLSMFERRGLIERAGVNWVLTETERENRRDE